MRARELALSLERPVVFAPNICVERWRSRAEAAAAANACVPGALLVCAGAGDAELMTGEEDPERAALALLKAGARMVVITLGGCSEGAILRGELRVDVDGVPASVRQHDRSRGCVERGPAGAARDVGVLPGGGRGVAPRGGGGGGAGVRAVGRA